MHPLEKRVLLPQDLKPINNLAEYKAIGGLKGLEKARQMAPEDVIAEVRKSGLRGRGGAGFPSAIKWDTVSKSPDKKKYAVCNFAEGEPGTYKDRYLCSKNPYGILEGILICAYAIGAYQAVLATKEKFKSTVARIEAAIKELEDEGVLEKGYLRFVLGPDEYLFGEEKALLEVIDGRDAMPRFFPPYMVGVNYSSTENNPAVVNNAETMAHVARILRDGADAFRANGSEDTPGTVILTLTGDVKKPGMYEVATGLTVRQFLYDLGGGPVSDRPFKAVFSGISNRVMTPDQFDLPMGFGTLREAGVGLGSGGFFVYDQRRSMVEVAWLFSHFLSKASCGQCVPCNQGTRIITEHLRRLKDNEGTQNDVDAIFVEAGRCTNQTRCFLPTQEAVVIPSILKKFPEEFKLSANGLDTNSGLMIPKVQSFDDETGQFVFESNPKEFRPDA
ncbi:MAG: SLBB domain-containing protein [Candidatus Omnitrophica bacterium]|nr:SLBB domain-containing protein [Candidatus Omnitrophota bacterium]